MLQASQQMDVVDPTIYSWLVGGQWDDCSKYMENITFSKPQTR
jgi:hypothetical protein